MIKRICPKCESDDVWKRGGMKMYLCHNCGYYFDNNKWEKIEKEEGTRGLDVKQDSEPLSDTNADSLSDWYADRAGGLNIVEEK